MSTAATPTRASMDPKPKSHRHITPDGYKRLLAEHDQIWKVHRPKVVREVEAAAALGDRSENAEYIYGKKKLRELDRRLQELRDLMDKLTVTEPKPHPTGRAYFGAWVTVELEDGTEKTYRLVGPDETEPSAGAISVDAPLGRALLGKRDGEVVAVMRPAGLVELTVVEVRWTRPEEE